MALALLFGLAAGVVPGARDFEATLRTAMRPYYAALVASARGDADGTRRQLVLFQAQWSSVQTSLASAPAALARDPRWPDDVARVTAAIGRAQALLRTRDVDGAHAELESIRNTLRDARQRHGLSSVDDLVLEFHDALERLVSRVPHRNEMRLRPADFAELKTLVDASHRQWDTLRKTSDAQAMTRWEMTRERIDAALREVAGAIERQDPAALSTAAAALKNGYFELLLRM
jgi:hypothetical protein